MVFERLTEQARRTIVIAQHEARAANHAEVDAEHLLIGAIGQDDSVAVGVLVAMGISPEAVRVDVVTRLGQDKQTTTGHIPFAPRAKKALEEACASR